MSKNQTCWNDCKDPVVTTVSGVPVCAKCADHYLGHDKPKDTDKNGDGCAYARQFE